MLLCVVMLQEAPKLQSVVNVTNVAVSVLHWWQSRGGWRGAGGARWGWESSGTAKILQNPKTHHMWRGNQHRLVGRWSASRSWGRRARSRGSGTRVNWDFLWKGTKPASSRGQGQPRPPPRRAGKGNAVHPSSPSSTSHLTQKTRSLLVCNNSSVY